MIENVDVSWNPEADGQMSSWQNPSSEKGLPEEIYDEQLDHKGITKKHWKETLSRHSCFADSCQQKFSLFKRHHHCRRCGEVFCSTCLKYQRKLNVFAHPDPEGKPYKVCQACFEEGKDSLGCVRSLTEEFKILRRVKGQELCHEHANTTSSCSEKVNIEQECQRLLMAFRKSIGTSKVKRTIPEMRRVIKTPEWQKSSMWMQGNVSEVCQSCRKEFSLLNLKNHCKVCGMVLCKSCSYKELLIYLPDEKDPGDTTPQLGVKHVIGCPEVEPKISLLLRICSRCRDKLGNIQLSAKFLSKLLAVDETLSDLQNKIVNQLTKEHLSACLAQYASKLQLVKGLQTEAISNKQKLLMKNYIMAKSKFYLDNMHTFHKMKAKTSHSSGLRTEDSQ